MGEAGAGGDPASAALGRWTAGCRGSGGGASVNVVFNVTTQDAASFRKSEAQVTGMLAGLSRVARALFRSKDVRTLELPRRALSARRLVRRDRRAGTANEIVSLTSGREKRNARFSQSRRHYDAGTGVRSLTDLHDVLAFFEARRGSLHAFRFRDPFDMKSCRPEEVVASDQVLGTGDGARTRFALTKSYGDGGDAYQRLIAKPVAETAAGGGRRRGEGDARRLEF